MERNLNHLKIVVIGSGNVATHLAQALSFSVNIVQIYSRNITNAIALAQKVKGCHAIDNFNDIDTNADIYLISAKDDAIKSIVAQTACRCNSNALWLHTSGSVPADVFAPHCQCYGVLYPLQTFSKDVEVNVIWIKVPLKTALQQNENRKGTRAYVPESVIRRMNSQMTIPTKEEGFEHIYIVENGKEKEIE